MKLFKLVVPLLVLPMRIPIAYCLSVAIALSTSQLIEIACCNLLICLVYDLCENLLIKAIQTRPTHAHWLAPATGQTHQFNQLIKTRLVVNQGNQSLLCPEPGPTQAMANCSNGKSVASSICDAETTIRAAREPCAACK